VRPHGGVDERRGKGVLGEHRVVGLATVGSSVTGVVGLFLGLLSVLSGEWQAAGLCLVAAGVAFGALANATLRR